MWIELGLRVDSTEPYIKDGQFSFPDRPYMLVYYAGNAYKIVKGSGLYSIIMQYGLNELYANKDKWPANRSKVWVDTKSLMDGGGFPIVEVSDKRPSTLADYEPASRETYEAIPNYGIF
jgi:hypothetical protein